MQDRTIDEAWQELANDSALDVVTKAQPFLELMTKYRCALMEIETKFKVLNEEFSVEYNRNPFESIKTRLKKPASIIEKLKRKGYPLTMDSIEQNLADIAGVRVICSFPEDIYILSEMLLRQDDIVLIEKKDYIANPKPNGYRSLHLIVDVPIFLSTEKKHMKVEVQFRTIAMDFWASLDHKLKYKQDVENPELIAAELKKCADIIDAMDYRMQEIRNMIDRNPNREKLRWCAIGDSITFLNDHLEQTGERVKNGYLTRTRNKCEHEYEIEIINQGMDGSVTGDFVHRELPEADLYTVLLGTNDWSQGVPCGTVEDFINRHEGTIVGNLGLIIDHIHEKCPEARIIVMNPVERGDFVEIIDPSNNMHGSYALCHGQKLKDISAKIFRCADSCEWVEALDLHRLSGFKQGNVLHFKRIKVDGEYRNVEFPDYVQYTYNPETDEYPYPSAAGWMTYDGLHPSDEGNERIASILAEQILQVPKEKRIYE